MQPAFVHSTRVIPRPGHEHSADVSGRIDWVAVSRAFVHPLKLAILEELGGDGGPKSASGLARAFKEEGKPHWYLGLVTHHVKALVGVGLVVAVSKRQVRGATETFYALAKTK